MIRPYRATDWLAVLDIYAQSKLDELRFEEKLPGLVPLDQDDVRLAKFRDSQVLVYERAGICGYAAYKNNEIRSIFVLPAYRRKGVGRALLVAMHALMTGPTTLHVARSNRGAQALYREYGYQVIDEFDANYNGVWVKANTMQRVPSAE